MRFVAESSAIVAPSIAEALFATAAHLTGPYRVENLAASGKIVVTNKVPFGAYRALGGRGVFGRLAGATPAAGRAIPA